MRKTINPLFFFYFNPTIPPPLRIYRIKYSYKFYSENLHRPYSSSHSPNRRILVHVFHKYKHTLRVIPQWVLIWVLIRKRHSDPHKPQFPIDRNSRNASSTGLLIASKYTPALANIITHFATYGYWSPTCSLLPCWLFTKQSRQ